MASQAITIGGESISGSLQGVEIRTFGQVYQGMMPKIRPINSPILIVGGQRIDNLKLFDENLSTQINTKKAEQFPNFELEVLSFGMPKDFRDETILEDMANFNPVSFINDTGSTLIYPQVLWNLSAKDTDSYDGVIEPLTIRARASRNSIDWPYDPHDVRGAVSNAAEDVRRRGNMIVDYVFPVDRSVEPYLDECFEQDTLGLPQPAFLSDPSDFAPPFEDGTDWEDRENYDLGDAEARLRQTLSDWDPGNVSYYTIANRRLAEQDFRDSIVAHFNFETSATSVVPDKTGNGHIGTLTVPANVDLSMYPGYISNRGNLDLTANSTNPNPQDCLKINHEDDLQMSSGSGFSFSAWFYLTSTATQHLIAKAEDTDTDSTPGFEYRLQSNLSRALEFYVADQSSTSTSDNYISVISPPSAWAASSWFHVVCTYDGGTDPSTTLKIYVDGSQVATTSTTNGTFSGPGNNSYPVFIGRLGGNNSDCRGRAASIEFWNTALSAEQISALYNLQLADQSGTYDISVTLGNVSTEQFFPRGSISARSGQFVNLEDSPGTDSIAYAGMKR